MAVRLQSPSCGARSDRHATFAAAATFLRCVLCSARSLCSARVLYDSRV